MPKKKSWLDKGIENVAKDPAYNGKIIVKNALPKKMSEVLLDFAEPLLDAIDQDDSAAFEAAVRVAVTAWNYLIVTDPSGQSDSFTDKQYRKSLKALPARAFSDDVGEAVLTALTERKKLLYPDNNRLIADLSIAWDASKDEYHLTVISAN